MQVKTYDRPTSTPWDDFVSRFPHASFYHLHGWYSVLRQTFGHRSHLLVAESEGEIIGCLPLVVVSQPGLGSKLLSIPYQASYGGPLTDDPGVGRALVLRSIAIARDLGVDYIEFRGAANDELLTGAGFVERHAETTDGTIHIPSLSRKTIVRGHRQDLNRVERLGIEIAEAGTLDEWRLFYEMFEMLQRQFAAIGLGWGLFRNLFVEMPHKAKIRLARLDGEVIAGSFLLCHHQTIVSKQAVVLPEHVRTGVGKALVWSTAEWGRAHGYERLNLGISLRSQEPVRTFKEGFGCEMRPLSSYVFAIRSTPPTFEDLYEGYGLAKKVWVKMPLPLTKLAGGLLSRWFC